MDTGDQTIEIFCSYAQADLPFLLELKRHLAVLEREQQVTLWADTDLLAGTERASEVQRHLNTAPITLLLVSPDFLASDDCYHVEMQRALERQRNGETRVVPLLLRPVDWPVEALGTLRVLPTNARPVTLWENRDEAFRTIVLELRRVVEAYRAQAGQLAKTTHGSSPEAPPLALPPSPVSHRFPRRLRLPALLLLLAALLLIASSLPFLLNQITTRLATSHTTGTPLISSASAQASLTANPYGGTLLFSDPMRGPGSAFNWYTGEASGNQCAFKDGAYHVYGFCQGGLAGGIPPTFAFEISLVAGQNCGRLDFAGAMATAYVCQNGQYELYNVSGEDEPGLAPSLHTGADQPNIIDVVADASHISLSINYVKIVTIAASNLHAGLITLWGVDASVSHNYAEVLYTNARLWSHPLK